MSLLIIKSPKHCAKHELNVDKLYKRLFYAFSIILVSVLSLVFIIWVTLHPSKPKFYLKDADIYQLNISDPHLLNSSIQISLVSNNPNQKVGIYYDQLLVYASYRGQQITMDTLLPPFYQEHANSNSLTASLIATGLPVSSSFGYEVGHDRTTGKLNLSIKVNGRLRWKVGTWVSGRYHFNVDCVAVMAFGPNFVLGSLISKEGIRCSTSV